MINREEFLQALVSFLEFSRTAPDREAGKALHELEALSPNSDLSGIIFCGAKERSPEEIVDEALLREALWKEGGRPAVRARIKQLMLEELENPNSTIAQQYSAQAILKSLEREENQDLN